MGKTGNYKIPFVGKSLLSYPEEWRQSDIEWRENTEFTASIWFTGWRKGRSAVRVRCKNMDTKEHYSMAMEAFYEAVIAFGVKPGGHMEGKFTFRKQGSNYGLYPVIDKK